MGALLEDAKVEGQVSKEAAEKFYDTFNVVSLDYDFDKEDLKFAFNNFGHFTSKQAADLFISSDADAGIWGGTLAGRIDPSDSNIKQAWWLFLGAYYLENTVEISISKQVIEYLESVGGISEAFPNTSVEYNQFNFNTFSEKVTKALNTYLDTENPVVSKPGYSSASRTSVHSTSLNIQYFTYNDSVNRPQRLYGLSEVLDAEQYKVFEEIIKKTNLSTESDVKWNNPAGIEGTTSSFDFSSNLTEINGLEVKGTNWIKIFYLTFFVQVLFQNTRYYRQAITATTAVQRQQAKTRNLKLDPLKERFESVIQNTINKDSGVPELDVIVGGKNIFGVDKGINRKSILLAQRIAQKTVRQIRMATLKDIIEKIKSGEITDPEQAAEVLGNSYKAAEEAVKNNEEIAGTDTDPEEASEEDIKAKQKFLKQCLLMSRLDFFSKLNIAQIKTKTKDSIHEKKPYKGRLYLIDEKNIQKDKSSIINKLLIPNRESIGPFLDIKPSEHASLVPKIRLVKVYSSGSALVEHEFKFPKHSNTDRVNSLSLSSVGFDRGADFGVKEFSFSFDGTTPATAKNDITANLKLYFQSFQDFVEKKAANGGHRYVDLLILPGGDRGTKKGSGTPSALQYDPSYYRIRADIGWEAESAPNAGIKKAIHKINKTFYLNMVDHDIDIRDDGSVEINVSYRAYVETALKGTTLDALASRESRKALAESREKYRQILLSKNCNLEQLTLIRAQFLQIEENLRKNTFQSIMKRLIENRLLYNAQASNASAAAFEKTGYISAPAVFVGDTAGSDETLAKKSNPADFVMKQNKFEDVRLSNNNGNKMINYFFLADLLYVVLDCLYEEGNKKINEKYIPGTENFKFLLSSFQYISTFEQSNVESVNIGNIPISVELFNEWFTDNVIKQERTSYPVMYFIRDIAKFLVTEILLESCFKNDLDKRLQFKTTSFLGMKKGDECPISSILGDEAILDVGPAYDDGLLPLSADIEGTATPVKDLFNYITIFAETTRGKTDKRGIKTDDEKNGIMHYQIGRDRGILKKIKFSKTDMQYIREARFFRHGNDGLMQLSAVYKISMDMVGNTLYYPGMEVFIDPRGLLGGGTEFDPTEPNSIANKLGFGGYHLVTSVKSSIGPGKFTTTVDALFSYNGDGQPKSKIIGSKEEITVPAIDKTFINEGEQSGTEKDYCEAISNVLYQESAAIGYGFESEADIGRVPDAPADTAESLDRKNNTPESLPEATEVTEVNQSLQTSEPGSDFDEFGFLSQSESE